MQPSGGLRLFMPGARFSAPSLSSSAHVLRPEEPFPSAAAAPMDFYPLPPLHPPAPVTPAYRAGRPNALLTCTTTSHATLSAPPRSGTSQRGRGDCIMAIIDNRALEVGVAFCQLPSLAIVITQFGDSVGFAKTLSLVFSRNPVEILVADSAVDGKLVQTLLRNFRDEITFTSVPRQSFSESLGSQRLHDLMSTEEARLEVSSNDRYICVAAANAVISFMEVTYNYTLQSGAVRVQYMSLKDYVEISRLSARALHLIPSGCPQHSSSSNNNKNNDNIIRHTTVDDNNNNNNTNSTESGTRRKSKSARKTFFRAAQDPQRPPLMPLVDALNHTLTGVGRRLLRSTVLQPLRDPESIQMRYDTVEWLRRNDEALAALRRSLRSLGGDDLERVISVFSHEPKQQTLKTMEQRMDAITGLWMLLRAVVELEATLRAQLADDTESVANSDTSSEESNDETSTLEQCHLRRKRPRLGGSNETLRPPYHSNNTNHNKSHVRGNGTKLLFKLREALTACRMEDICSEMAKYLDENVIRATWQRGPSNPLAQSQLQPRRPSQKPSQQEQLLSNSKRRPNCRVLQIQRCFAVQQNLSGTLDAARHKYTQTIDAMFTHVDEIRKRTGVGSLQLAYDRVREYHLYYDSRHENNAPDSVFLQKYSGGSHYALFHSAILDAADPLPAVPNATPQSHPHALATSSTLPVRAAPASRMSPDSGDMDDINDNSDEAVQDEQRRTLTRHQVRGRRVTCTTSELLVLRRTATDAVTEILRTQNDLVRSLIEYLRQRLGKLQAVCDAVAMLDLLIAFTLYARLNDCTCPLLLRDEGEGESKGESGTHFTDARHPGGVGTANTIRWDSGACLLLVTGPNASGKTTLLRQVGQLMALAQSGCPVPARSAALRPCDRIIAHMLCDDLDDTNISSFGKEMRELSYLCMHVTQESLVLVDELGRRTTVREGTGIAWATAEFLLEVRCRTLFVTHFGSLTKLATRYPREVTDHHLAVATETRDEGGVTVTTKTAARPMWRLRFEYRLLPGPCEVDHYGMRLAAHIGFFEPVLNIAKEVLEFMTADNKTDAERLSRLSEFSNMARPLSVSHVVNVSASGSEK